MCHYRQGFRRRMDYCLRIVNVDDTSLAGYIVIVKHLYLQIANELLPEAYIGVFSEL